MPIDHCDEGKGWVECNVNNSKEKMKKKKKIRSHPSSIDKIREIKHSNPRGTEDFF